MEKIIFTSFPNVDHAKILTDVLENKIPYEVETDQKPLSEFYVGQSTALPVHVKIEPGHFTEAHKLWEAEIKKSPQIEIPEYLNELDNNELLEILKTPDKQSIFDQIIAKKLLNSRGVPVDENFLDTLKAERLDALKKPIPAKFVLLVIGYFGPIAAILLSLIFYRFPFFFSFFGIAMGMYLYTIKKTLPNGNRIHIFTKTSRYHGLAMAILHSLITIGGVILLWVSNT